MIGQDRAEQLARMLQDYSKADETQITITSEQQNFTRFNQNWIHQNLSRNNHQVNIRVSDKGRIGAVSVNTLDESELRAALDKALHFASYVLVNPTLKPFPKPKAILEHDLVGSGLLKQTPRDRADTIGEIIAIAKSKHAQSSGTYANIYEEMLISTSSGIMAYHAGNHAVLRTVITKNGTISGYADQIVRDPAIIDPVRLATDATWKASLFEKAIPLEPGNYDTVFEATAVADLLRFLGMIAFGAQAVQEGRSFMGNAIGKQVFAPSISIYDDAYHPLTLPRLFDSEGTPKQKVTIIENGVAKGVVYDNATAEAEGKESTGHASAANMWGRGQYPGNMVVAPGDSDRETMIKSIKKGLLVTRFHYTHCPEPMQVVATGTTRDGTFLIEDGEIVARVFNLRFTESMIRAFANVAAISKETRLTRDWWSTFYMVLPTMMINDFTYTGASTF